MLVNCLGDNQESPFEVGGTLARPGPDHTQPYIVLGLSGEVKREVGGYT